VLEVGGKSIRFMHEMRHGLGGELCATSDLVGVYIDVQTRKSRPIPESIAARAKEMLGSTEPAAS
jgi:acyl-CoA thioester hydrolase